MEKTILVAGKDSPAGSVFAEGLTFSGRNVVVTGDEVEVNEENIKDEDAQTERIQRAAGFSTVEWTRASAVSARTIVLQTENLFSSMDEAVLFFDEEYFASLAQKMDAGEIGRSCDEMITGYQYLTMEILSRFEKKNSGDEKPGKLIFLLKEGPCVSDVVRSPSLRNGSASIASPLVASAAGAFTSFAENIVALYGDTSYANIILVRGDLTSDTASSDDQLAKWLSSYLDEVDGLKSKLSAKKSLNWIKPGAKAGGGFSFFK